ncbi:MAG TPA: CBS domain-containing protein [Tepidisphaeraceae bacterium]|nr:CBS domain-containing protein [Tepidisphaeraceae bacterium]
MSNPQQSEPRKDEQTGTWRTPGEEMEAHSFEPAPPEATNAVHPAAPGEQKSVPGEGVVGEVDAGTKTHPEPGKHPGASPGALRTEALNPPSSSPEPARPGTSADETEIPKPDLPSMDTGIRPPEPAASTARHTPGQARVVRDVMTVDVEVCNPNTELYYVARMMAERDIGAVPVVESTNTMHPIGIITDRDIVVRVIAKREDLNAMKAADCMSTGLLTVDPESDLLECMRTMEERQVRRAPVVDSNGRLIGIITQADIAESVSQREAGEFIREVSEPTRPGAQGFYH